jgi:hypothetical protein
VGQPVGDGRPGLYVAVEEEYGEASAVEVFDAGQIRMSL